MVAPARPAVRRIRLVATRGAERAVAARVQLVAAAQTGWRCRRERPTAHCRRRPSFRSSDCRSAIARLRSVAAREDGPGPIARSPATPRSPTHAPLPPVSDRQRNPTSRSASARAGPATARSPPGADPRASTRRGSDPRASMGSRCPRHVGHVARPARHGPPRRRLGLTADEQVVRDPPTASRAPARNGSAASDASDSRLRAARNSAPAPR